MKKFLLLITKVLYDLVRLILGIPRVSVQVNLSSAPYFVGAYEKIAVRVTGIGFDDVEFTIVEGAPGGYISKCRDAEFNPAQPDIMVCFGFKPGTYHIEARKKSDNSLLDTFEYKLDTEWKDNRLGPSSSFHGVNSGFAFGATWGGGGSGPQNMSVVPATGTRKVALLLVDTSSQRYTTNSTDLQAIKDKWRQNLKDGFVGTDGTARSAGIFYREACFNPTNSFELDGDVFGPVQLANDFDSYIDTDANPRNGFDQACITAGDSLINYNDYKSVILVVQPWNTTDSNGNPIELAPWPQAWGGTYSTSEGSKTLGVVVMPHNWTAKPIYATIAHELGHNLGLGDQYGRSSYSSDVNNRDNGELGVDGQRNPPAPVHHCPPDDAWLDPVRLAQAVQFCPQRRRRQWTRR